MKLNYPKAHLRKYYYSYTIIFIVLLILLLINVLPYEVFSGLTILDKTSILLLTTIFVFNLKSRISFIFTLISLVIVVILLLLGNKKTAELWAMTAYNFLAMGLVKEIFDIYKEKDYD